MVQIAIQDIFAQSKQINQQDEIHKKETSQGFLNQLSLLDGQFYSGSPENGQK